MKSKDKNSKIMFCKNCGQKIINNDLALCVRCSELMIDSKSINGRTENHSINEPNKGFIKGLRQLVIGIIGGLFIIIIFFLLLYLLNEILNRFFDFSPMNFIIGFFAIIFIICMIIRWYQRLFKGEW